MRHKTQAGVIGGAVLALGLAVPGIARAGFVESFEDFEGDSGTTVAGYTGDDESGTWTLGGGTQASVVVGDGTAYAGENYLRINDASGGQHHVHKTFTELVSVPEEGVRISFALRRAPQPGGAPLTGANFGTKMTDATEPGNTGTEVPNVNVFQGVQDDPEDVGVWFRYQMDLIRNDNNQAQLVDFSITDTSTGTEVFFDDYFYSSVVLSDEHDSLSWLRFFTHGTSRGVVDVDAITYAAIPEPASLALLGAGGLALISRRGRGSCD